MINLYPHQQEALEQTKGFENVAVYHDMGLGKTFTGSEVLKRYGCKVNLVVCQKSKIYDWVDHFHEYYSSWSIYDLRDKSDLHNFIVNMKEPQGIMLGVINYDMIWRRKELLQLKDFTLMLDESSLIQNRSSKRTKFILKMNPAHSILLSGTPVGGKYENLWTQIHLLGWNISEKLYNRQYINWRSITIDGMVHKIVDKDNPYKNIDRLKSKMREHGAVFKKTDEVMDLPKQVFTNIKVKPTREYRRFMKNYIIDVEGDELVGDTTLTRLLYSRQLCAHYNENKLEAFKDLLKSTRDRLIVFYTWNEELERLKNICEELERPVSQVNGHVKDLTAFRDEDDAICLCQYQSASKGLNLHEYGCNKMIYFSLPLSSEDFEQSKKRIHRIGQEKTCFYYLMICADSVEEKILKRLKERKDYTDALFEEDECK